MVSAGSPGRISCSWRETCQARMWADDSAPAVSAWKLTRGTKRKRGSTIGVRHLGQRRRRVVRQPRRARGAGHDRRLQQQGADVPDPEVAIGDLRLRPLASRMRCACRPQPVSIRSKSLLKA